MTTVLKVSEIFGPTLQGEGPSAGAPCFFLRLAECNLTCNWCDTPYTWAFTPAKAAKHKLQHVWSRDEQIRRMSVEAIWSEIWPLRQMTTTYAYRNSPLLVISGGEPLLQQEQLRDLLVGDLESNWRFEIETAGTLRPNPALVTWAKSRKLRFNVSPKLESSGNVLRVRRNEQALQELAQLPGTAFKFVVTAEACARDLAEIDEIVHSCGISLENVYLMPEGQDPQKIITGMQRLAPLVIERGYKLTTRLHTLIWNDERGR